jgi:hypothetical protein
MQTSPLVGYGGNPIEFCITIPIMLDCSAVARILGKFMQFLVVAPFIGYGEN